MEHGCHDPAAVTAAVLADVSHSREAEEDIKQRLGIKTAKVWREVKLFLDPKTCQVDKMKKKISSRFRMITKDEHHKKDEVCVDKECKLSWLRGRHFSISADLAVAGWCCLLARMVTEVKNAILISVNLLKVNSYLKISLYPNQAHWPCGWTPEMVTEYLGQLTKLTEIILDDNADIANVGMKNLLNNMVNEFHNIVKSF